MDKSRTGAKDHFSSSAGSFYEDFLLIGLRVVKVLYL